jgi:gliding motility-associated lipoprotein GldH
MRAVLLLYCLGFLACSPSSWSEKKSFSNGIWAYGDSLVLSPQIEDTSVLHNTWLEITVDETYPYRNLYIHEAIRTPSDSVFNHIQEFELMKEDGTWLQKPGLLSGGKVTFRLPILSGFKFKETGNWQVSCKEYMRTDSLEGVHQVKWTLE